MKDLRRGRYSGLIILLGLLALLLATGTPAKAGLLGQWHMDEASWDGTPGEVVDSSGMGNHGTAQNGADTTEEGLENRAGSFDGVNDRVEGSDAGWPSGASPITLEAWIKTTDTSGHILLHGTPATNQAIYLYVGGGNLQIGKWGGPNVGSGYVSDNQWHYVAGVWNGSNFFVYVDGEETDTGTFTGLNVVLDKYYIGNISSWPYSGLIDEVAVYDYALSPQEVWEHYKVGVPEYFEAGEALTKNDALYLKSDGKVYKAKADDTTRMPAIGLSPKIANSGELIKPETTSGKVITGFDFDAEDIGKAVYVAATAGDLVVGSPSAAYIQKMGMVKTEDKLLLTIDHAADMGFHDRGDPALFDFSTDDFIIDSTWRELDLSPIVPAGAKTVLLRAVVRSSNIGVSFSLKKNGNPNSRVIGQITTQAINRWVSEDLIVACDNNRKIAYSVQAGATWDIVVVVKGWWK